MSNHSTSILYIHSASVERGELARISAHDATLHEAWTDVGGSPSTTTDGANRTSTLVRVHSWGQSAHQQHGTDSPLRGSPQRSHRLSLAVQILTFLNGKRSGYTGLPHSTHQDSAGHSSSESLPRISSIVHPFGIFEGCPP